MALSEEAFGEKHPSTYGEALEDTTRSFELSGEAFGEDQMPGRARIENSRLSEPSEYATSQEDTTPQQASGAVAVRGTLDVAPRPDDKQLGVPPREAQQ